MNTINRKILIKFADGLIGDFFGGMAAIQTYAKLRYAADPENPVLVDVAIHPDARKYTDILLLPPNLSILPDTFPLTYDRMIELDSSKAFQNSATTNTYMSNAYYNIIRGKNVKTVFPIRAFLTAPQGSHTVEAAHSFIISPFARSLPPEQKVFRTVWQDFVDSHPDDHFIVVGNTKYDDIDYITGPNVTRMFDQDFQFVLDTFKVSKGVISVVTGTSHLAFHSRTKNFLITNQNMAWGNNPDAIKLTKHIPDIVHEDLTELVYG